MQLRSRSIVSVRLSPWMAFDFSGGGAYFFKVRICKYIEVANYPLIQLGVSHIDLVEALSFNIGEILAACPLIISSGSQFPYAGLGGTWTCPTDLKFDTATAPVIVNPNDYTGLSVIPWTIPTFFESDLTYIPMAAEFTPIPESIPNYWKQDLPGAGAVFMPNKDQYSLGRRIVAIRHFIYEYSSFTWWGQFVYEGSDLESIHVLLDYDLSHPTASDPNSVYTPDECNISTDNESAGGYPIYYETLTGVHHLEVGAYSGPEAKHYPPREPIPGGGFPWAPIFQGLQMLTGFGFPSPGKPWEGPKL